MKDEEFELFLKFFSPPENLKASLCLQNISQVTSLADKYLCPVILDKCRQFIRRRIHRKETNSFDRSFLINISFKHFPDLLKEDSFSRIKLSQIDFSALESFDSVRPILFEAISKIKNYEKNMHVCGLPDETRLYRYDCMMRFFI